MAIKMQGQNLKKYQLFASNIQQGKHQRGSLHEPSPLFQHIGKV